MNSPHHLSWENFRSSILIKGQQRVHRVAASPSIEIFSDGAANRIGLWLEAPPDTAIPAELSKLAFITTRSLKQKQRHLLEVATTSTALQRQFYHFATAVSERVLVEKKPAIEALTMELQCFADLLESKSLLGTERQLGLLGELIFLERLMAKNGADALDAWIGPLGEPHDFRLKNSEFEVKTTISPHRTHTINGSEQLVPSKGCSLCLISVQLGPAGASSGFTLAEKVESLSKTFTPSSERLQQFTAALETCGLFSSELAHYTRRFVMRRPLALVHVDNNFPAITRPVIQTALGTLAARVESIQYDVNLEGLEHEDGTGAFAAIIPN
jgi:hypothetical protein